MTQSFWTIAPETAHLYGKTKLDRPPVKLIVSLSNTCNLKCFHCRGTQSFKDGFDLKTPATRPLIDFIVDQVVPEVDSVRLGGLGVTEQLIAPDFDYFMERMDGVPLTHFQLTTNLSVMTPQRANSLARNLTEIETSLEGIGEHFKWARKMPWDRFKKNFEMLRDAKLRNPGSRMKLTLLACVIPSHFEDFLQFDLFKEMGVNAILLREIEVTSPELKVHRLSNHMEATRAFAEEFKKRAAAAGIYAWLGFEQQLEESQKPGYRSCWLPYDTITVSSDGSFGVCCKLTHLTQPKVPLKELKLMAVWNSPEIQELRAQVNSSKPGDECRKCEMKVGHLPWEDRKKVWEQTEYFREKYRQLKDVLLN